MTDAISDAEQRAILAASPMERNLFHGSLPAHRCVDCGEPCDRRSDRCLPCASRVTLTDRACRMSRFHRG